MPPLNTLRPVSVDIGNPLLDLPEDERARVNQLEGWFGNGDSRIDPFELADLVLSPEDIRHSLFADPEATFEKVRMALIGQEKKVGKKEVTNLAVEENRYTLEFGDGLMKSVIRNSLNQVSEIRWSDQAEWIQSMEYEYDIGKNPVVTVRLKTAELNGALAAEELFIPREMPDGIGLPVHPDEMSLLSTGLMDIVQSDDRNQWLAGLMSQEKQGRYKSVDAISKTLSQSHPQLASRFLHSLLLHKPGDTETDTDNAIRLADLLWNAQVVDGRKSKIERAAAILMNIPNLAHQGLLMSRLYVNVRKSFDDFLKYLPKRLADDLRHLLQSLKLKMTALPPLPTLQGNTWSYLNTVGPPPKAPDWRADEEEKQIYEDQKRWVKELQEGFKAQRDRDEETLKQRTQEKIECGQSGVEHILEIREHLLERASDEIQTEETDGRNDYDLVFPYQASCALLAQLTAKNSDGLWTGRKIFHEKSFFLGRLAEIRSDLTGTSQAPLGGKWTVWHEPGFDEIDHLDKRVSNPAVRSLYAKWEALKNEGFDILAGSEKKGDVAQGLLATRPDSLIARGFFPMPLSHGMFAIIKDDVYIEIRFEELFEWEVTFDYNGYKFRIIPQNPRLEPVLREGLCYVEDVNELLEMKPLRLIFPDGREEIWDKEYNFFKERHQEEIIRRIKEWVDSH
ncbi:MAG: hypothetical protein Q7T11_08900 [Deltaproteobacteria bacterium]|nr:hypothetical protein [Deltaproteobacteria bacterium]